MKATFSIRETYWKIFKYLNTCQTTPSAVTEVSGMAIEHNAAEKMFPKSSRWLGNIKDRTGRDPRQDARQCQNLEAFFVYSDTHAEFSVDIRTPFFARVRAGNYATIPKHISSTSVYVLNILPGVWFSEVVLCEKQTRSLLLDLLQIKHCGSNAGCSYVQADITPLP